MAKSHIQAAQILLSALFVILFISEGKLQAQKTNASFAKCWNHKTSNLNSEAFASDNAKLFISEQSGSIQAIDPRNGARIWSMEIGGEIISNFIVSENSLYAASKPAAVNGTANGGVVLRSMSKETGVTNWAVKVPFSESLRLGATGNNITAVDPAGRITTLTAHTGNVIWTREYSAGFATTPQFGLTEIAFGTNDGQIVVISNTTGETVFSSAVATQPASVYLVNGKRLIWGDERGNLILMNMPENETVWRFKSGAKISSISEVNGAFLVTSFDNFVYMLSRNEGNKLWKKRQAGRIASGPLVTKDFIVVTANGGDTASFIDKRKGKLINQIQLSDGSYFIQTPLLVNYYVIFLTSDGIVSYGLKSCSSE